MDEPVAPTQRSGRSISLAALLVIVTLLGVLAAVGTAGVVTVIGAAPDDGCVTEVATVQTAMDAMMSDQQLVAVDPQESASDRFTDLPTGPGSLPLAPRYMPVAPTVGRYTWDATGTVTQVACP